MPTNSPQSINSLTYDAINAEGDALARKQTINEATKASFGDAGRDQAARAKAKLK